MFESDQRGDVSSAIGSVSWNCAAIKAHEWGDALAGVDQPRSVVGSHALARLYRGHVL